MSMTPRSLMMIACALVAGVPAPADAQQVRRGSRAAVSPPARVTGAAVRVPRDRRPGLRHGRFRQTGNDQIWRTGKARGAFVQYVPYTFADLEYGRVGGYADASAIVELRDAALDAREAALDARAAALELREAIKEVTHPQRGPENTGSLIWKPGGITPADPADGYNARTVFTRNREAVPPPATRVHLGFEPVPLVPVPDCGDQPPRQRPQERRRFPWGLGWLARYGRDIDVERGGVAPPSYYLRSPLLSGLYRRQEDCPDERPATCATVTLVGDDDAAVAVDVPLPQLEASSPRSLRDAIRTGLDEDRPVVLRTDAGEEFDLLPGSVREIGARACGAD